VDEKVAVRIAFDPILMSTPVGVLDLIDVLQESSTPASSITRWAY